MHIGPFALVSLLVADGVAAVPGIDTEACLEPGLTPGCQEYIDCCCVMSIMVGLIYLGMWFLLANAGTVILPFPLPPLPPPSLTLEGVSKDRREGATGVDLLVSVSALRFLRLGFVVDLLSDPVMSAVTTSGACSLQ